MFRRLFIHSPIRYVIALVVCGALSAAFIISKGNYLMSYIDGFSAAGAVSILFGALVLVTNLGAFDMFSYSFAIMRKANREFYKDLYQYSQIKKEKRSKHFFTFVPYMVVGLLFIIIALIMLIFL